VKIDYFHERFFKTYSSEALSRFQDRDSQAPALTSAVA
jgi:hypothetical protein